MEGFTYSLDIDLGIEELDNLLEKNNSKYSFDIVYCKDLNTYIAHCTVSQNINFSLGANSITIEKYRNILFGRSISDLKEKFFKEVKKLK